MNQPAEAVGGGRPGVASNQHALNLGTGLVVFAALFAFWQQGLPVESGNPNESLRAGDVWLLRGSLLASAGWLAIVGTLLAALVVELARRELDVFAGCVVMLVVVPFCLPALCGSGSVMERWRWAILGLLVLGASLGVPLVSRGRRRLLADGRGGAAVAAAGLSCGVACGIYGVLSQRANLQPALNLLAAFGVQLSLALTLHLLAQRRGWWKEGRARRALRVLAGVALFLGLLDATGALGGVRLAHARWVVKRTSRPLFVLAEPHASLAREWAKVRGKLAPRSVVTRRVSPDRLPASVAPRHPFRVVIVVFDALRQDSWGGERTPNLARLAAEGTVYERAYSPAPGTGHSLPAYLTSLHPRVLARLRCLPVSLPGLLKRFGYETRTSFAAEEGRISNYSLFEQKDMSDLGFTRLIPVYNVDTGAEHDARLVDAFVARMQPGQQPTLDYLHFMDTHGPFATRSEYAAAVRRVDEQLGRVIDHLQTSGLWDATVVLVFGDHGEALGEHGMYQHAQALYEEQVAVPLVVRVPGSSARRVPEPLTLTQVPSIVMEALGGAWSDGTAGEDPPRADGAYAVQEHHILDELVWRSVRQPPYVYHRRYLTGSEELYDLSQDPGELRDLSEERLEVLLRMRALEEAVGAWESRRADALNALAR